MTTDLWSGRLDASSLTDYCMWILTRKMAKHTSTKARCNGSCRVIYEHEAVGGERRWQADCRRWCQRSAHLLLITVFMETDVNHLLRGRWILLHYSIWSLTHSLQWTVLSPHSWILLHRQSASFIMADSDPLELATIQFQSDNHPVICHGRLRSCWLLSTGTDSMAYQLSRLYTSYMAEALLSRCLYICACIYESASSSAHPSSSL